ncbi:complement factor H isoform X2 [Ictalurus punctatus]|uniref:Complement factor H isoform X2 n=1 Tax=Ictalurus punctatus TaxID=7998 RepID=A0A9F7TKX4_ICTPU|nr:complement factor H isoform X2 [Ictalurus punctatus]
MKKKIIILAFSVWSCQAVMGQSSCTAPVVPNAKPKNELAASYPTGSFIGYVCDSGYEFVETHYALCEDGTWNLPVCKLQTSCTVPFVPNAKLADEFTAALYPTGSSVQFVCDRGSEFEGTKYALCKDGTWKLPVCKILDHAPCASPHVPNARPADALAESYPSGSSVRFGCDGGYEFEGTDSAQCEDGVWTLPVCKDVKSCLAPSVPNGQPANALKTLYGPGETLRFVCDSGYEFEGTRYAVCDDGSWRLPVCKVLDAACAAPNVPNAKPENELAASYPAGSSVRFGCDGGYEIEGTRYALCEDGTWRLPVCTLEKSPCSSEPAVRNARPADELRRSYNHGDTVQFICNRGYTFEDTDSAQCEDGTWKLPECIVEKSPCSSEPAVRNARPADELRRSYNHGDTVQFICNRGYTFQDTDSAQCENGTWKMPECIVEKSPCSSEPAVRNARPADELRRSYNHGDTVQFICNRGYTFEDTDSAQCEDGTWKLPECIDPTRCTAPRVANAQPSGTLESSYRSGDYVVFRCDRGYEFERRHPYATCADGTWRLPVCQKLCGTPSVPNARPTVGLSTSYSTGSYVSFKCNSGYEFVGEHYAKCVDGNWELPVCKSRDETVCSAPHVPNARPVVDLTLFYATGRTVRFVCDSGYEFEGTDTARCEGGIWSLPVCKVRNCGTQPLIENGDVTELAGGNELKAQCKRLYKLTGPGTIRCVNGKWTEIPVCKPPCKLDRTKILRTYHPDKYLQEGETKRFYCSNTYQIDISCIDETPVYGECKCILCFIETPSTNLLTENFTISTATYIRGK